MLLSELPVLHQLFAVELVPLQQRLQGTPGKSSLDNASVDLYGDPVFAILGVEMGWSMIVIQHVDDDSEKP